MEINGLIDSGEACDLMSKTLDFVGNDNLTLKVFLMVFLIALCIAIVLLFLYHTGFLQAIGLIVKSWRQRMSYE